MSDSSGDDDGYCPLCKTRLSGDYCHYKFCDGCGKIYCLNCIALTGCQTTWGICKNCYDYKCRECHIVDLDRSQSYLDDEQPIPVCDQCLQKYDVEDDDVDGDDDVDDDEDVDDDDVDDDDDDVDDDEDVDDDDVDD